MKGAGWKGRPASERRGDDAGECVGVDSGVPYCNGDDRAGLGRGEAAGPGADSFSSWNISAAVRRGVCRPRTCAPLSPPAPPPAAPGPASPRSGRRPRTRRGVPSFSRSASSWDTSGSLSRAGGWRTRVLRLRLITTHQQLSNSLSHFIIIIIFMFSFVIITNVTFDDVKH